jgi:hypothetical protein
MGFPRSCEHFRVPDTTGTLRARNSMAVLRGLREEGEGSVTARGRLQSAVSVAAAASVSRTGIKDEKRLRKLGKESLQWPIERSASSREGERERERECPCHPHARATGHKTQRPAVWGPQDRNPVLPHNRGTEHACLPTAAAPRALAACATPPPRWKTPRAERMQFERLVCGCRRPLRVGSRDGRCMIGGDLGWNAEHSHKLLLHSL